MTAGIGSLIVTLNLVPRPTSATETREGFTLTGAATISGPPDWQAAVRRLLTPGTGCELLPGDPGTIRLVRDETLDAEAYRLVVDDTGVTITAADLAGVNWATQTLRQLLPVSVYAAAATAASFPLPGVEITDRPRFSWRGVMLDTCRHFVPLAALFSHVDLMAQHKYNVFHLHLTEDQGWRFASTAFPKLAERASWRSETQNPLWDSGDGTPHGGFYTPDQLRALVAYAAQRGITIVPEIEFPGHVRAFLTAYPEFGNAADLGVETKEPATTWGVFDEVLDMSDAALEAVFAIFTEVLDIFPGPFVHVGGDECPRTEWYASPAARRLAEQRGLPGPDHLQRWFTEKLRDWLAERGRRLVGWDEINDGADGAGPLAGAVAMAWRDAKYGLAAAEAGLDVVMSPEQLTYFNYYPSRDVEEPYCIGGNISLADAYGFDPLEAIPPEHQDRVLGTQCQLWTEYIPNPRVLEYMLWPRACAHSEVAWSDPAERSYAEFEARLTPHLERLSAQGVNFRPLAGPLPWQQGGSGRYRRPDAHRTHDLTETGERP